MLRFSYFLFLCCLTATSTHAYIFDECSSPYNYSVDTLSGPVNGSCYTIPVSYSNNSNISYDVMTWLSIPYAEPPTGANRFLKPVPVKAWTKVLTTKEWPLICPQNGAAVGPQSEDCLYLNVFIRADSYNKKESDLKPVLIYIHGGGFIEGTSATDLWEPSTLVASQDIVVVTFNYRVNILEA